MARAFTAWDEDFLCRRGWEENAREVWALRIGPGPKYLELHRNDTGLYVIQAIDPGKAVGMRMPFKTIEDAANAGALAVSACGY